VLGTDEAKAGSGYTKGLSTRKNAKWESTVFAGPKENEVKRKVLAKEGAGKSGLYGDECGSESW